MKNLMKSPKVEDALTYLDEVKERFSGQGAIYTDFLDVMREFKMQTIGTEVVIRRVRELFEGHPDLIDGFNNFIPLGYRMDAVAPRPYPTVPGGRSGDGSAMVENLSPTKTFSVNTKTVDGVYDWPANHHYDSPCTGSPIVSCVTPQPHDGSNFRSGNAVCESGNPQLLPNPILPLRGLYSLSPNTTSHSAPVSHVYQQQQQAQSFSHAIHYVNKIKNRFQEIPDIYKRFLEILQWYQREQRHSDLMHRKLAEKQVYQDVAKLFDGHDDLLQEFGQFLPESTGVTNAVTENFISRKLINQVQMNESVSQDVNTPVPQLLSRVSEGINLALSPIRQRLDSSSNVTGSHSSVDVKKLKRLAPAPSVQTSLTNSVGSGPTKKPRCMYRDVSVNEVNQLVTGPDVSLLHKIRLILDADGRSYQTFLQTLNLYNRNLISADELLNSTRPLFPRNIDIWKKFCDMIATASPNTFRDHATGVTPVPNQVPADPQDKDREIRLSPNVSPTHDPSQFELTPDPLLGSITVATSVDVTHKRLDLDFSKLRTCGVSYRALPASFPQPKCSGRLKCPIAREVLNDTFISFSSLTSEDSQFVSSKKNQYEEHMYRVEDERYEVDMVTELNRAAMQNLVVVKRRMDRMNREELSRFVLDDSLGGTSAILMRKAIHRVYGDKAGDVIYGLKNCPSTVIPLVIKRMRQKDSEWREAIRVYQRSWEEQDSRNYLRSLDHQGTTFKQRDAPAIRSKTMISQIEAVARDDVTSRTPSDPIGSMISSSLTQPCLTTRTDLRLPGTFGSALINVNEGHQEPGAPHLSLVYPPPAIRNALLQDAASLIIHHVKRQSNSSKEDKRTMKFLMRTVVQDFFMADRFPMSDDEDDEDDDDAELKDCVDELDDQVPVDEDAGRTRSSRLLRLKRLKECRKQDQSDSCYAAPDSSGVTKPQDAKPDSSSFEFSTSQSASRLTGELSSPVVLDTNADRIGSTSFTGYPMFPADCARVPSPDDSVHSEMIFPQEEHYSLLYGNNHWYSFLRLHHLLLCRLHLLRSRGTELSLQLESEKNSASVQAAEILRLKRHGDLDPSDYYGRALNLVKDLLDGGEDVNKYEDRLRNMFGIYAYPWFTLDRLVINIVRQLHALASGDELSHRLTSLHRSWTCGPSTDSSCGSPFRRCNTSMLGATNANGVRGPICTRVCRLVNEAAYRAQALAVINSFSNQTGSSCNGSATQTNTATSAPSGPIVISSGATSTSSSVPNCYALVMLSESSTLLIRLISPSVCHPCDSASVLHPCFSTYSGASQLIGATAVDPETNTNTQSTTHWFHYLTSHLVWTLGHVPRDVASHIRPVFLYRTVRRCVKTLTYRAYRRRQQQLIDTGDTQPEELLLDAIKSHKRIPESQGYTSAVCEAALSDVCSIQTPKDASMNFEHDVWVFMRHVFKSDLTRKELFRDTFSSDCMQFTNRMNAKANSRTHKINWSVGSYGIFIRFKRRVGITNLMTQKWRQFHAHWLETHTNPVDVQAVCSQFSEYPCAIDETMSQSVVGQPYSPQNESTESVMDIDKLSPNKSQFPIGRPDGESDFHNVGVHESTSNLANTVSPIFIETD